MTQALPLQQASVPAAKTRPALRLVKTQALSRDEWLDVRKRGIGSSDAGAAVGLNPYKSSLALWLEKTGRDDQMPKINPEDDTSPAYWGTLLEPIVAAHYTRRTGHKVRRVNAVLQHPQHPWMLANIDREVVGACDVQILECKTAGLNGARLWKDGVPDYVQLQVMHQLAVTGKQAADVAVLIGGQELQIHRIERDEAVIAQLIELERQFWHWVETDQVPPADGSVSAEQALRCLYPHDSARVLDLSQDESLSAVFTQLLSARQALQNHEALEARCKQLIQQRMGDASKAVFADGSITWKRSKDSLVLDTAQLLKDQPDLLQSYGTTRSGSRRFLVQT